MKWKRSLLSDPWCLFPGYRCAFSKPCFLWALFVHNCLYLGMQNSTAVSVELAPAHLLTISARISSFFLSPSLITHIPKSTIFFHTHWSHFCVCHIPGLCFSHCWDFVHGFLSSSLSFPVSSCCLAIEFWHPVSQCFREAFNLRNGKVWLEDRREGTRADQRP